MNDTENSTAVTDYYYYDDNSSSAVDYNDTISPNATTDPTIAIKAGLGGASCIITLVAIAANLLVVAVFSRFPSLRNPGPAYLLLNITVANLIVSVVALIPNTVAFFTGGWLLGDPMCQFSAYMSCFAFHLTVHTVGVVFFERYLKVCRPLKHTEIFTSVVTLILIGGLWFFAAVLTLFPLVGWGEYSYLQDQRQCWISAAGWQGHLNHMVFTLVMTLLLPFLTSLVCLIAVVRNVAKRRKVGVLDALGDQEKTKESYGRKIKRKERALGRAIREKKLQKKKKDKKGQKNKKNRDKPSSSSSSSCSSSSSFDEDERPSYKKYKEAKRKQKAQRYRANEAALVRTLTWVLILLIVAWVPYMLAKCLETLEPVTDISPPTAFLIITAFLTYATYAVTPLILLLDYRRYREALVVLFTRKKLKIKEDNPEPGLDLETGEVDSGIELSNAKKLADGSKSSVKSDQ